MRITTQRKYRRAEYGYGLLDGLLNEVEDAATFKEACQIIKHWRDCLADEMAEADKAREEDKK